jgi:hypothetical protein
VGGNIWRPMISAEVETAADTWIGCDFLIDTGADFTVLSPAVLQQLGRPTTVAARQLGGIGGSVPTLEVWTTIRLFAPDGSVANVGGMRSAFGVPGAISDSILGLDILRAFALIADLQNDVVCLLLTPHSYTIQG